MLKTLFGFFLVLVLFFASSLSTANATTVALNNIIPWQCPPTVGSAPPTAETAWFVSGDRLYLHVIDSQGNDLEIWCISGWPFGIRYWQVFVSTPNGKSALSKCEFSTGHNVFTLTFNGTRSNVPSLSGSIIIHIDGELESFKHDNDDFWDDVHTTYNFTSGEAVRIETKKSHTPTTVTEKVVDTDKKIINRLSPPSSIFAWNEESSDPPSGETLACTASEQDEISFVHTDFLQTDVEGSPKTFLLYYPEMIGIDEITINKETKSLQVLLSEETIEDRYLSISIPRDLIDHSEEESFTISDGTKNQIVFEESTTVTYRTLNFDIPTQSSSIEISGTLLFNPLPPQSENVFDLISPKKQQFAGVSPEKILCNEGLELILKADLESSACVKPQTVSKLEERGWALETSSINSFEECVAAGNPVMESYPRQCRTADGKHFVEIIPGKEQCEIAGGLWGIWGNQLSATASCNPATSDVGKECTDSSQCQSFCQANEGAEINSEEAGKCYGYELAICMQEVRDGVVDAEWCQ